jgi:tetratricopeptide (TPR) repeat protein
MLRKIVVLAAYLAALGGSAFASSEQWEEVRSSHFTVITDSNEKQGRHILDQFERMRWMFETLFPKANVDPVSPIMVLAARNAKSFQSMEPEAYLAAGQLKLAGYFLTTSDKNYVLLRLDADQEHPFATVYHEYTHLQFAGDSEWMPLWLNEGLAEFVQNTEIRDKDVLLGEASKEDILYLRQNQIIPLPVLFKVDSKSPYYHEEQKGSIFYAESWALTHYLFVMDKQNRTNRVGNYMTLLSRNEDPVTAAEQAFGDLKQLQNALDSYIRLGTYKSFILSSAAAPISESTYEVRVLAQSEADAARADVLACVGRAEEARALLATVLKADPNNIQAHETMGFLEYRAGHHDEARNWYGEAVKLGSQNYLSYYYFAASSMGQGAVQDTEIEANLRTAIRLNPRFAPAYEPLASLLWSKGRYADAEAVLQSLLKSAATPSEAAAARAKVAQLEHVQAAQAQAIANEKAHRDAQTVQDQQRNHVIAAANSAPKHPNEAANGPKHELVGVIRGVSCGYPAVIEFKVESGKKSISVYNNNYYKMEFSTLGFQPEGDLNPCSAIEGMKARVQYAESTDKTVDGQAIAVELRK